MWLLGNCVNLLRQSRTCSASFLCNQPAVSQHLRLCRTHMDSLCDNTGRIKPEPVRTKKTEYLRAVFYVGIGLLLGSGISRKFAAFLEENELFVPDEEDVD